MTETDSELAEYMRAGEDTSHVREVCSDELLRIQPAGVTAAIAVYGPTYLAISDEYKPMVGWLVILQNSKRETEPGKLLMSMPVYGARPHDERFRAVVAQLLDQARGI